MVVLFTGQRTLSLSQIAIAALFGGGIVFIILIKQQKNKKRDIDKINILESKK